MNYHFIVPWRQEKKKCMISEHFFHFLIYETCGSFGVNFINRFTKLLSIRSKIMTHYKTGLKHAFTTF